MRRVTFLLRMWVIVGAVLLLLQTPKGDRGYAEYSPGSCINYAISQPACPSGCTNSKFTQMTPASGNGVYYLGVYSKTPCGSAKQGETCSNPTQYVNVYDFDHCCAGLGLDCTGVGHNYMNCCDSRAECMPGVCCLPTGQTGCGRDNDCCSGNCFGGTCCPNTCPTPYCSNISGYCWAACGCPGASSCSDCYYVCYSEMYAGCESVCTECGICCP